MINLGDEPLSKPQSSKNSRSMADEIVYFFLLALFIGILVVVITLYRLHMRVADLDFDNPLTALQTLAFVLGTDALLYPALKELAKHLPPIKIEVEHSHLLMGIGGLVLFGLWFVISFVLHN